MTTFVTIDFNNSLNEPTILFHPTAEDAVAFAEPKDHFMAASAEDLNDLSGASLVVLYNTAADEIGENLAAVKKFTNKEIASKRTWANLVDLKDCREEAAKAVANVKAAEQRSNAERDAAKARVASKPQEALTQAVNTAIASGAPVIENIAPKSRDGAQPAKVTDYPAAPKAPRKGSGITLAPKSTVYACKEGTKQALFVDLLSRPEGATMEELLAAMSTGKPWLEITVKSGLNWDMNKIKGYGIRTTKRGEADCYHLVMPAGMVQPLPHTPRKKV